MIHGRLARPQSIAARPREVQVEELDTRLRGHERRSSDVPLSRLHQLGLPPPASDFSRIPASVALGVIASGSILRWMIDGLPGARAAANAAGKSALFSTTAP